SPASGATARIPALLRARIRRRREKGTLGRGVPRLLWQGGARPRTRTVNLGIKSPLLCQIELAGLPQAPRDVGAEPRRFYLYNWRSPALTRRLGCAPCEPPYPTTWTSRTTWSTA